MLLFVAGLSLFRQRNMKGGIVQSLYDLLQVLYSNAACVGCGTLRPMAGFMAQQGINPEFSDIATLVSQFGRNCMPERMEGDTFWQAKAFLEF